MEYLDSLGVLDSNTLCVHAVHVSKAEIVTLAEKKVRVCLCPGSNRFLGVGKAPVTEFLAHGILPALGTDSRASNTRLSMWREMASRPWCWQSAAPMLSGGPMMFSSF